MRLRLILCVLALAVLAMPATADEVDDLLLDLKYGSPDVREKAALALGEIGDPRAVDPLIEILNPDRLKIGLSTGSPSNVFEAAIIALGRIGDPRSVEPLCVVLSIRVHPNDQRMAAWALGEIGDPRAVDPLIEYLEGDRGWYMPQPWGISTEGHAANYTGPQAIIALVKIGDPRAVDPLIGILNREYSSDGKRITVPKVIAANALGAIGDPKAVDALIGVLSDRDAAVRSNASWALGEIGDARATEPLLYVASSDWDPEVREVASQALEKLGAKPIPIEDNMTGLILDLKHGTPEARSIACLILADEAGRDDPRTIDLLIDALKDPYPIVREYAARGLGIIGDQKAVDPLMVALSDRNDLVRNAAARALGQIGDPRAVGPLCEVSPVTPGAIVALGEIGGDRATNHVMDYIRSFRYYSDEYPGDRRTLQYVLPAIEALGKTGDTKTVDALSEILTWRDPVIRVAAVKALGNTDNAAAIEPLTYVASRDESEMVREAAAEALENIQAE